MASFKRPEKKKKKTRKQTHTLKKNTHKTHTNNIKKSKHDNKLSWNQAVTPVNTAFFSFSCALSGAEAEVNVAEADVPSDSFHNVDMNDDLGVSSGGQGGGSRNSGGGGEEEKEEETEGVGGSGSEETGTGGGDSEGEVNGDGGDDDCRYFYSLNGGNYSAVVEQPTSATAKVKAVTGATAEAAVAAAAAAGFDGVGSHTLLLTGLADGAHVLRCVGAGSVVGSRGGEGGG